MFAGCCCYYTCLCSSSPLPTLHHLPSTTYPPSPTLHHRLPPPPSTTSQDIYDSWWHGQPGCHDAKSLVTVDEGFLRRTLEKHAVGFGRQHGVPIFCNQWGVKVDFSLHHLTQPPHHLAATSLPPRYRLFTSPPPPLHSPPPLCVATLRTGRSLRVQRAVPLRQGHA